MNGNEAERLQRHLMVTLAEFTADRRAGGPVKVLEGLVRAALRRVGGGESASVTTKGARSFATATSSDEVARTADVLQHDMGHGPALEAIATREPCHLRDVTADRRWPELGAKLAAEGVGSALSVPLGESSPDGARVVAASLNLYAMTAGAFSPTSVLVASVLAANGGPSWAAAVCEARYASLEHALATRSDIGSAIGLLMGRYALGHQDASELLRAVSTRSNRKVADLAVEVIELGGLPPSAEQFIDPSGTRSRRRGRPRAR